MKLSRFLLTSLVAGALAGCGSDDSPDPDGGSGFDSGTQIDSGSGDGGPSGDAGVEDADTPSPGEWQIPEANRVGRKLTMYPLYPRPDDETGTNAYHRVAHPSVPYRVRLAIQGGEWPFRYELLEGPAGARLVAGELDRREEGERIVHQRTPGYGVLEWTEPAGAGPHTFRVQVTDQGGEAVELTWTVSVDEEAFVFVDAESGSDDAAGTIEAPLRTFAEGLWKNDDADATFAGRIAIFRAGEYAVYASEPLTSPVLDSALKPSALVGMPGEAVTFDLSQGHFRVSRRGGMDDLLVAGIDFVGSRPDLGNVRLFNIVRRSNRVTFWEVSFDQTSLGTVATDNPACLAFMSDGPFHENLAVLDSTLGPNAASQLIVTFDSRYVLLEGNHAEGVDLAASNGDNFLHAKDDTNDLTIRDNLFVGRVGTAAIAVTNQITLESAANQEVCWNRIVYDGNQNVDAAVTFNRQSTTPDAQNAHAYRNSVVSQRRAFRFSAYAEPIPVTVEGNALWGDQGGGLGGNVVLGPVENVVLEPTDFDERAGLVGDAWTNHAGLAGADIVTR